MPGHKRGQSTIAGTRGNEALGTIQQQHGALNIHDVAADSKGKTVNSDVAPEISAQKRYKLELQAEINKLRSKYNNYASKPSTTPSGNRLSEKRQSVDSQRKSSQATRGESQHA